jgi:ATP-dependent Lhr-like helicase
VLVDGALVLYLERGGRSALAFSEDDAVLAAGGARSLVDTARAHGSTRSRSNRCRVRSSTAHPRARLLAAGFVESSRG